MTDADTSSLPHRDGVMLDATVMGAGVMSSVVCVCVCVCLGSCMHVYLGVYVGVCVCM